MLKKILIIPLGLAVLGYTVMGLTLCYNDIPLWVPLLLSFFLIFPLPLLPLAQVLPKNRFRAFIHRVAEAVIGIYLYVLIILLFDSTLCYITLLFSLSPPNLGWMLLISLLTLFSVILLGGLNARKIKVVKHTLTLRSTRETKGKIKAIVFSDLHLGFFTTAGLLNRLSAVINAEKPDVVFFAGDLFDSDYSELHREKEAIAALQSIKPPLGFFACPGNHDAYAEKDPRQKVFFDKSGIILLRDESFSLPQFTVFGRKDRKEEQRMSVDEVCKASHPLVVLDHQPDDTAELLHSGAELVLCGHTHNGQTFPGNIALKLIQRHTYGLFERKNCYGYTTSGVGYWGIPLRIFTNNEIAVLQIEFQ